MHARLSVGSVSLKKKYDASRGGVERGARIAADVVPWLVPGRVLEVGVGTGIVAAALRARGRQVHGVDLSAAMLRRALDRLGPTVVQADALALPVASAALDNVLFVAALHVIGDVAGAVAEAARVLRPGGRLVAVYGVPKREPADDDIGEVLAPLALLRGARPDTPAAMDAAAAAAGLEPAGTGWVAPVRFAESPNTVTDGIAERLWSYLWRGDERARHLPAARAARPRLRPRVRPVVAAGRVHAAGMRSGTRGRNEPELTAGGAPRTWRRRAQPRRTCRSGWCGRCPGARASPCRGTRRRPRWPAPVPVPAPRTGYRRSAG